MGKKLGGEASFKRSSNQLRFNAFAGLRMQFTVIALILAIILVLAGSLPYVWDWINRPISIVKVEGEFHNLSKKQLKEKLASVVATRFFGLKLTSVQKALLSMPWVKRVDIRKTWPGTLWVKVYERKPAAHWNAHSLVDTSGAVFTPVTTDVFKTLPVLKGAANAEHQVWTDFLWVRQQLSSLLLHVTGFDLNENEGWVCQLNDVTLLLGKKNQQARLRAFKLLYAQKLKKTWHNVARVDLRYPDGAAVAWKDGENKRTSF